MELIAKWIKGLDSSQEEPSSVVWEDGRPATIADYRKHEFDTCFLRLNNRGEMERHLFPNIIADVVFEPNVRDWVIRGQDVTPTALDIKDPKAPDEDIFAALITLPTLYRARIIR